MGVVVLGGAGRMGCMTVERLVESGNASSQGEQNESYSRSDESHGR